MGIYYTVNSIKDISKIRYGIFDNDGEFISKITVHSPNINDIKEILKSASAYEKPVFQVYTEYTSTYENTGETEEILYSWFDISELKLQTLIS